MNKEKSLSVLNKHKNKVLLYIIFKSNSKLSMDNPKCIVSRDMNSSEFTVACRKKIKYEGKDIDFKSIFFLINSTILLGGTTPIGELYDKYKNPRDLVMYITCLEESVFG